MGSGITWFSLVIKKPKKMLVEFIKVGTSRNNNVENASNIGNKKRSKGQTNNYGRGRGAVPTLCPYK